jgi:hypothetical protein
MLCKYQELGDIKDDPAIKDKKLLHFVTYLCIYLHLCIDICI